MPISVNTNVGALAAMAASTQSSKALETAMTRLSTGKRINTAGDDAAGIAIAARLTSEVKGLGVALKNALDGQSLIDTTEGAQAEVTNILQRMRELAVKAANDTNSASDRKNIDAEVQQLVIEIDRISSTTTWAGVKILHGENALDQVPKALSFQVGFMDEDSQKIDVSVKSTSSKTLDILPTDTALTSVFTPPATGASNLVPFIDPNGGISFTPILPDTLNTASTLTVTRTSNTKIAFSGATYPLTGNITLPLAGKDIKITLTAAASAAAVSAVYKSAIEAALPGVLATISHSSGSLGDIVTLSKVATTNGSLEIKLNDKLVKVDVAPPALSTINDTSGANVSRTSGNSLTVSASTSGSAGTVSFLIGDKSFSVAVANAEAQATVAANIKTAIDNASLGLTVTVSAGGVVTFVQNDATVLTNLSKAIDAAKVPGVYMTESTTTPGTFSIAKHAFGAKTAEEALSALTRIDIAIEAINDQRSALGAISNRLTYTVNNLTNIVTNLDISRGRIEDADFALESANMARAQILQQAGTAMLAQANASKQDVLSLIK
ncbi:MAG: flagellin [Proteobacteria bacterium]|nr:flagellin [Pseudomonadota bacterium]